VEEVLLAEGLCKPATHDTLIMLHGGHGGSSTTVSARWVQNRTNIHELLNCRNLVDPGSRLALVILSVTLVFTTGRLFCSNFKAVVPKESIFNLSGRDKNHVTKPFARTEQLTSGYCSAWRQS